MRQTKFGGRSTHLRLYLTATARTCTTTTATTITTTTWPFASSKHDSAAAYNHGPARRIVLAWWFGWVGAALLFDGRQLHHANGAVASGCIYSHPDMLVRRYNAQGCKKRPTSIVSTPLKLLGGSGRARAWWTMHDSDSI